MTLNYVLTNTSTTTVPVSNPTINDGRCATITRGGGDTNANNLLDNGERWAYSCGFGLDRAGGIQSTATATATSTVDLRQVLAPSASWTVTATAPPRPVITLVKTANPASGIAPFGVTYTYSVLNESGPEAFPVSDVTVTDAGCAPATSTGATGQLDRGEIWTFTCATTLAQVGSITASAFASGKDTFDGVQIYSNQSSTTVTASSAPVVIPAPDLTPSPTATSDASDRTATPMPSTRVRFSYTGRFTPARACRGRVTLTLKAGTQKVATKRVSLNRKCRFKVSFDVARTRLKQATRVTVTAKSGKRTASRRLAVPKT